MVNVCAATLSLIKVYVHIGCAAASVIFAASCRTIAHNVAHVNTRLYKTQDNARHRTKEPIPPIRALVIRKVEGLASC